MTKDEALKLALEALEDVCGWRCNAEYNPCFQREAITAIKEALAQPAQEPVALVISGALVKSELPENYTGHLYTNPPQREWVGLTDEQWQIFADTLECFITRQQKDIIEAKLKEKNT